METILNAIRTECLGRQEFTREDAVQEILVLESIQSLVRDRIRQLAQVIREEDNALTTQQLEEMPVFDWTEENEYLQEIMELHPVPSPRRKYRNCADDLEPLFQNHLISRLVSRPNGYRWLECHLGIPKSTLCRWNYSYVRNPNWRPWLNPNKGTSYKFRREDCDMLKQALLTDPRMTHKEVNSGVILEMLQEFWTRAHPYQEFPQMCVATVRRLVKRWGWSWRRAHKRRRPGVNPDAGLRFVYEVLILLRDGVEPWQIVNADETAFVLYPHGFYTWARRGRDAVQIHVEGNEKQSYTVMVAVTMDCRKLPLFTIVQGKTARSEWGLKLDSEGPHVSTHSPSGWMTAEAMMEWLRFLRGLPMYIGTPVIHVVMDGYATHLCNDVTALADGVRDPATYHPARSHGSAPAVGPQRLWRSQGGIPGHLSLGNVPEGGQAHDEGRFRSLLDPCVGAGIGEGHPARMGVL